MRPNDRRCVSCRRVAPKAEFWRVVRLAKTATVCLDQGMGRSAYLCPQADCLRMAQRKNRLGRALKVPIPDALWDGLWQRLNAESAGADTPQASPEAEDGSRKAQNSLRPLTAMGTGN